jgi:alkylation response protein AidB-like acyl-CoA dehydrogenase
MSFIQEQTMPAIDFASFPLKKLVDDITLSTRRSSREGAWPAAAWQDCMQAGVPRWFVPVQVGETELGGWDWTPADQLRGLMAIASADLTTAFVLTQFVAALRRMIRSDNVKLHQEVVPELISGEQFATIGISHLATSRQHLAHPSLRATRLGENSEKPSAYVLDGVAPWVTGGRFADVVVVGASCDDGREVILAVPIDLPGIQPSDGASLVALSGSGTDQVRFDHVEVDGEWVVSEVGDSVAVSVRSETLSGGTGSLQTSALAVGLSRSAILYLQLQSSQRPELKQPSEAFAAELAGLERDLLIASNAPTSDHTLPIRARANDLVIRSTQAALMAAKGTGFVQDHSVGRWCREALFFLVWSCPEELTQVRVCELAGMAS